MVESHSLAHLPFPADSLPGGAEEPVMVASEQPSLRLWTRDEYHRAAETGIFRPDERLELLDGKIVCKVRPQSVSHAVATGLSADVFRDAFDAGYHIREEKPM